MRKGRQGRQKTCDEDDELVDERGDDERDVAEEAQWERRENGRKKARTTPLLRKATFKEDGSVLTKPMWPIPGFYFEVHVGYARLVLCYTAMY